MAIRYSLLDPPPEMHLVADLLSDAVDALLIGDAERAGHLLQRANIPSLWVYAERAMNPPKGFRAKRAASMGAPVLGKTDRAALRMPNYAQELWIYQRDGYRCRYCGSRVVLKKARQILTASLPAHVPWPSAPNRDKHAAFYALNSVIDHVVPHSRGGDSSPDNLVTACWPCNFYKEDATLEELGLDDPRSRPPVVDGWDGLERIVKAGKSLRNEGSSGRQDALEGAEPTPTPRPIREASCNSLDEWIETFRGRSDDLAQRLAHLLHSLEGPSVRLSTGSFVIVNVTLGQRSLAVLGIGPAGDVDVPWLIRGYKDLFKAFAMDLAHVIPGASLYETRTMWRVDGGGAAKGQISVEELLAAADVLRESLAKLVRALQLDARAV